MREQKKRQMKCILWGQADYQNQMMVSVRKGGKGGDTIAPNSSKWGSLTQQTHIGKAAGASLGLQLLGAAEGGGHVYAWRRLYVPSSSLKKCLESEGVSLPLYQGRSLYRG